MKNYSSLTNHEKSLILIKILYFCKKIIPNNNIFWCLFFITKFLGPFIITANFTSIETEFIKSIRNLVYFKNFETELNPLNYKILSIVLYFFLTLPIFFLGFVYTEKTSINHRQDFILKFNLKQKILLKFSSIILFFIFIFSQHIIEILSFPILILITDSLNTNSTNLDYKIFKQNILYSNLTIFKDNLLITLYPTFILNFFFIIFTNIMIFYFIKLSNDITSSSKSKLKLNNSFLIYLTITLIGNLQALHYYDLILNPDETKIKLIMLIISLIILAFPCASMILDLNFNSLIGKLLIQINLICIFLGIINAIFHDLENTIFLLVLKLIFSATLSFIIFSYCEKKSYENISKKLLTNFFEDNKNINIRLLLLILQKLTEKNKSISNLYYFIDLINEHKQLCKYKKCNCWKYELSSNVYDVELKNPKQILQISNFIIEVLENELFGSILNTDSESFKSNKEFCLLHIDFVFSVKHAEMLAYYLIDVYTNSHYNSSNLNNQNSNIPNFYILYKLFEFKKIISKTCIMKKKFEYCKYYENSLHMKDLVYLKNFVIKNFNNYEKLYALKQNILNNMRYETELNKSSANFKKYDINKVTLNNVAFNFEDIIDLCEELTNDYRNLKKFIVKNYSKTPLKNAEMGFILFHFFNLFLKKIPISIRLSFTVFEKYDNILILDSVYKEIEMRHPIITKVDTNMNFYIQYISQKLCDSTFYNKSDLLDKDLHILIPEIFSEMHSKILKTFVFIEKQKKLNIDAYLITKRNHYWPVSIKAVIFPCLDYNVKILIDLRPIKQANDTCFDEYYFILDRKMNIVCFSYNFEEKYSLNYEFFKRLNINFCDLFGINLNLLNANFIQDIINIEKNEYSFLNEDGDNQNNFQYPSQISGSSSNGLEVFNNILQKIKNKNNNLENSENSIINNFKKKSINRAKAKFIEYLIKKDKLIPSIIKLKNSIYEKESDKDLYEKLVEFERKINNRATDVNFFSRQQSLFSFSNYIRGSTIFRNSAKKGTLDLFNIYFNIVSIGNIPYYQVKLIDFDISNNNHANTTIYTNLNITYQNNNFLNIPDKNLTKISNKSLFIDSGNNLNKVQNPTIKDESFFNSSTGRGILNNSNSQFMFNRSHISSSNINFLSGGDFNKKNSAYLDGEKKINFENLNKNLYTTKNTLTIEKNKKKTVKKFSINNQKKKLNKINSVLKENFLIFFYISVFILLILLICNYPLKYSIFTFSQKLSTINYYIIGMKSKIFTIASGFITECTEIDNIDPKIIFNFENSLEKIKQKISERSGDLTSFTYGFFSYLDEINFTGIIDIDNIVHKEQDYSFLYPDWTSYKRSSSFITQLKNFNYLSTLINLTNQFSKCRVRERFYNKNFFFDFNDKTKNKNSEYLTSEEILKIYSNPEYKNSKALPEEIILFYIFENFLTIFKDNLLELNLISNTILKNYHTISSFYLIIYNTIILVVVSICIFFMFYYAIYLKENVKNCFIKLFPKENYDKFFEMKLINYKSILNSFDYGRCIEFENRKLEINQMEEKENLKESKIFEKDSKKKKSNDKMGFFNTPVLSSLVMKDSSKSSVRNESQSLISGIKILKEKEINSINLNPTDYSANKVKFDHLDLKIYSFAKIFLTVGGLILLTICVLILLENISKFGSLFKGSMIAYNFIERFTKFSELMLYYKISIIYNDSNFIQKKDYIENPHLNYYNVILDIQKEGIFNKIQDSQFSNLYFQFVLINANINLFINEISDETLPNMRKLESKLNTKDFCVILSTIFTEISKTNKNNLIEGFTEVNKYVDECNLIGNGNNNNPLNTIIDSILTKIKLNYFDYTNSNQKNITKFIGNDDVITANLQIDYIFKKINDSIMILIKYDMDDMYNKTLNLEIIYSIISIVVFFLYIFIFLFFIIKKMNRYNKNLTFTLGRFKKALIKV